MKHFTIRVLALLYVLAMFCAGCAKKEAAETPRPAPAPETKQETPAPAPEPEPEPDNSAAYAAYLGVLESNREAIDAYNWQKDVVLEGETPERPTEPVVFADVWGDGTPELIYLTVRATDEGFRYAADLHVCTWDGAEVRELYAPGDDMLLDGRVGGGMIYRLFQLPGEKNLWLFTEYYAEGSVQIYTKLAAEGGMAPELTFRDEAFPMETQGGEWTLVNEYQINGKPCEKEDYEALVPASEQQAAGLLMRNMEFFEYDAYAEAPEDAYRYPEHGSAMTCDDAIAFLRAEPEHAAE